MRNLLIIFLFGLAPFFSFAENQQGYIYVIDIDRNGEEVYYVSPILECSFYGEAFEVGAKREALEAQYLEYIESNYGILALEAVFSDWLTPSKEINVEESYNNTIANLPIKEKGGEIVKVAEFSLDCQ